jgi:hypothetical protein
VNAKEAPILYEEKIRDAKKSERKREKEIKKKRKRKKEEAMVNDETRIVFIY